MSFVVTEACVRCKYTDCVEVCPMHCFLEGPEMLVIDADACIDCAMCVPECPVDAIVHESEATPAQAEVVALNARLARAAGWLPITRKKVLAPGPTSTSSS
ncbi:ferredoxin family protein [Ramlibacter sp. USB13]|uniref:Ferredoxin n=1 Tax=Ramlibacter cellulosilyticus TaxID=2764187 RepID=A0A923S968_9BURK|nr:ferredoxin family protein [Ramlibacter cellulosilyticus]MBC5781434.1 ferredoxin family protein [Ramlibacter cellulosilyticus]